MGLVRRNAMLRVGMAIGLAALLAGSMASPAAAAVTLEVVAGGFSRPLYVTHAGDARLFVVEQGGLIKIVDPDGSVRSEPFLDVTSRVATASSEQGLLGLAFHPKYATNGLFYINYTRVADGATVVAEYRRSASDVNRADAPAVYARRVLLIKYAQPVLNHTAGWMAFKGKHLYIATGDGSVDPENGSQRLSQNLDKLHGKILRINPLDPDGNGPASYGIPATNPFVGRPGRDEIWAYGLRNPWRCSFDRADGKLWCGDVGQETSEEIDRSQTGQGVNYGWPVMEGSACFEPPVGCNTASKELPVAEYSHATGCSVTGGYVARRPAADLFGKYIFGDFCYGLLWVIDANHTAGAPLPAPIDTDRMISSFGEGHDGRIYLTDWSDGTLYYVNGT